MYIYMYIYIPRAGAGRGHNGVVDSVGQCADFQPRPEMLVVFPCSHVMQVAKKKKIYIYTHTYF